METNSEGTSDVHENEGYGWKNWGFTGETASVFLCWKRRWQWQSWSCCPLRTRSFAATSAQSWATRGPPEARLGGRAISWCQNHPCLLHVSCWFSPASSV